MSNSAAGQWVKFFNASGIPSPAAATYAHIFVENRIQIDMLMDLNKEYLREMGITPMGDIIAILRHAKHVSDQTAREKVLSTEAHVPVAAIPANPVLPIERTKIRLKSVTASSTSAAVVAPLPPIKPRRVLPEHEGKYKIKLPSGTTERSKQILAKQAKLYSDREAVKPSVFHRLTRVSQKITKKSSWNKSNASPEVPNSHNKYAQDEENWDDNDDILRKTTYSQEIIYIDDEQSLNRKPGVFQRLATISKEIIDIDKELSPPRRNRNYSKQIAKGGVEIIDIDAKEATRKRNAKDESYVVIDIDNGEQTKKNDLDIYNRLNKTINIDVDSEDSTNSSTSVICNGLVYSDREAAREKKDIFKRLAINSSDTIELDEESSQSSVNSNQVRVKITGIGSKAQTSSSIFSRLGGKSDDVLTVTKQIKPILKNTAKNRLSTIVKAKAVAAPIVKPIKQKVLLVKKVPLKKDSDDDDNRIDQLTDDEMYDDIDTSGGSEKFVKFASTAEVREIAPRRHSSPTKKSFIARQDMIKEKAGNVKARLGGINSRLHSVKKPVNLKASPPSAKLKTLPKMKADLTRRDIPIHKRLGGNNNISTKSKPSSVSTISKRLGQVNIENKSSTITTARGAKSVFDRLGYSS